MAGAEYKGGQPIEQAAQREGAQPTASPVLGQGGTFGADQPLATRRAVADGSPAGVQPVLDSPTSSARVASPVRPANGVVVSHREQPITSPDPERSRAKLAGLLAGSVPVPDSSSVLIRVTTRAEADAILQHVPPAARRGFVREVHATSDQTQRHVIGIFSVDPTEKETWQSQPVAAQHNGSRPAQRDNVTLFEHDSGPLTLRELALAQEHAQVQSGQRVNDIRGRVVFGRFDPAILALLEEEHDRSRHETRMLQAAAEALLPPVIVAKPASKETLVETSYSQARQKIESDIAALDDPTFEAVKNWVRLKEAEIAIQSARYPADGTPPNASELKTAGERLLQIDGEIDEKARGINERRYLNAQAIFRKIFDPYQRATQENTSSGDALTRGAEKDRKAFEIFKRDFEDISKYKDLTIELHNTNRDPGSVGFDLMVDALVVYRAEINGDPETSETYERAVNRLQRFNPGITEEEIREEITFIGKIVERFAQSINLPPDETTADEQIAKRNWAILELIEHFEQMKLSEQKNHRAYPLPAENGSEETNVSVFVGNDSITGAPIYATLGEGKDELEFGEDKKEDFRRIYQTAQVYIRAHPELLKHVSTHDLTSGNGIRDSYQLTFENVAVIHDEQTAARYEVQISLSVDYFANKDNRASNNWINAEGDAVELPAYVILPEPDELEHVYTNDPSEQVNLSEAPHGFRVRGFTIIPKNAPIPEVYAVTNTGFINNALIIKGRKEDEYFSRIPMGVKNRKRLKDVLDALPE